MLRNPAVDMAVFEVARGGILREGLGYDRNDVALVTNVTADHLGLGGIETVGQLALLKSALVEAVPRSGTAVLNADDPLVARMVSQSAGRVVYFSMATQKGSDGWDRVDGHCGRGGAAFALQATLEGELIVLRLGSRTMPVLGTHLVPATFGGKARMNVANALGAAAAAWAAGAGLPDIRQGLRTFTTSFLNAPGRLNLLELGGIRIVIDYCHNVDGMRSLADFVGRMMEPSGGPASGLAGQRRRPGDRRRRHPGRSARRGPAGLRPPRQRGLRRALRPRGPRPPGAASRRVRCEHARRRPRGARRRRVADDPRADHPRRAVRGPRGDASGRPGRPGRVLRRRCRERLPGGERPPRRAGRGRLRGIRASSTRPQGRPTVRGPPAPVTARASSASRGRRGRPPRQARGRPRRPTRIPADRAARAP